MENSRKSVEVNNSSTFKVTTLFGQAIDGISLFLGFGLFLLGVSGALDLIIESFGLNAKMINASHGVVFIISGLFVLWRYKPKGSNTTTEEHVIHTYGDSSSENKDAYKHIMKAVEKIKSNNSPEVNRKILNNLTRGEQDMLLSILEKIQTKQQAPVRLESYSRTETSDKAMLAGR